MQGSTVLMSLFLAGIALGSSQEYKLDVELLARNLGSPIDLTFIPGDKSGRRFIIEQDGRVLIMEADNSIDLLNPFLNIQDRVLGLQYPFDERGFLGFAFHPKYTENGKVYARYTANRTNSENNICYDNDGTIPTSSDGCPEQHSSRLSEFTVSAENPNLVDTNSEKILIDFENPTGKNIGAGLGFGPDGLLYTGYGDGGGIYGPGTGDGYADASEGVSPALYFLDLLPQDLTSPYGKILRIDVDSTTDDLPYGIPSSNPWANNAKSYLRTVYAWGFRNPYRLSFDSIFYRDAAEAPANGFYPFWISAPSETLFDATNLVDEPGNYGWPVKQGSHCFARANPLVPPDVVACSVDADCVNVTVYGQDSLCGDGFCSCNTADAEGFTMKDPVIEYVNTGASERPETAALIDAMLLDQPIGRASLGGSIYRGSAIPWLFGKFVNGDFAIEQLNGQVLIATDPGDGSVPWPLELGFVFDKSSETKAGFVKAIGEDAEGELYAITGEFDEFFQIDGRVFKIVDASLTDDSPANSPVSSPTGPDTAPVASPSTNGTSAADKHVVSWSSLAAAMVFVFFGF